MKLFELYESPVLTGAQNLKSIATAATTGGDAAIMLGGEPITLEHPEARYIYGLYKQALKDGRQEQVMQMLANPAAFDRLMKPMRNMLYRDRGPEMAQAAAARIGQPGMQQEAAPLMTPDQPAVAENTNTLKHIVKRFPKEVRDFAEGRDELSPDLYETLFDYYMLHGEMPYGVAKGRTGDPFNWVTQRFEQDVDQYLHLHESLTEGRKQVSERWDDDDDDWYGFNDKKHKTAGGGTVTKTSTGVVHKGKYGTEYQDDGDEDDYDEWGNKKPTATKKAKAAAKAAAAPADTPKRGRGRPSAAMAQTDSGTKANDYGTWYRKVKRSHEGAKVVGSRNKAVAVVQKGNKNFVAGEWSGNSGDISAKLAKTISAASLNTDYKSGRGRPKKVREFIENLRYVLEAKNHMGETEYNTYSGWRAACKRAGADEFDGDRDICQAKKGGKGVGEWDGAVGTVYDDAHKKAKK